MEKLLINNNNNNILEVLKILDNQEKTKEELLIELNIKTSTFYKYINLLKKAGFNVWQKDNKFEIINFKKKIKFAKYELGILAYLILISNILLAQDKTSDFEKVIEKITHLSDGDDYKRIKKYFSEYKKLLFMDNYQEKIDVLNKLIDGGNKIKITTKEGEEFDFDLKTLNLDSFEFKNPIKEKQIVEMGNIVKISQDNSKDSEIKINETIFEINGKLSKSYLLREDERIIDSTKDKIIVASANQDKDELYRRLLRYDVLCKIIFPKTHVEEFKKMIEKSLDNLKEFQDNI